MLKLKWIHSVSQVGGPSYPSSGLSLPPVGCLGAVEYPLLVTYGVEIHKPKFTSIKNQTNPSLMGR